MNISEKYLKTSFEDLMKEHIDKIYKALGLLNSMVLCGENHTDTSTRVFYEAKKALEAIEQPAEVKPVSDEDIINASQDYVIDIRAILPTETAKAYQAGAMDMRDNNIHQITKR
jgi:hypothetical protein